MAIPQTFIQELVARADVVEIVGRYVQLKKGGANFMGLCPFHGEKSPSFTVSPAKQFYHCFGCGKNGNAISFLMDHAGMTFIEAVKDLAQQYGMQVPEEEGSPQERARALEQREKQQTLTSVLEKAGDSFRSHLKQSPRAIEYFKGRGVSGEIARQFGLGYAPQGWRNLASVFPHYDDPLLVESGLVITNTDDEGEEEKRYDRFRDRVMFPIRNIKGECIGFGGRVLGDDKPKYLNSPETPVFSKGRELYGLFEARTAVREQGYVLVTEGYMDVVALAQLGFPNAVATLGTACTHDHVQKLFRFTDAVVFSFDGDNAGRRAAHKALEGALPFATDVRSIKFLFLPTEHDPDSFIRANGKDAFAQYVAQATPLSRFLIESAQEDCDLSTAEGRAHMGSNAKPLWSQLPDGALKLQLLSDIAKQMQLDTQTLQELWRPSQAPAKPVRESHPAQAYNQRGPTSTGRPLRARSNGRSPPSSRADHAARIIFRHCGLWEQLSNDDHTMLCELPAPHGPLFVRLEGLLHEHGPLAWSALQTELQEHEGLPLLERLMGDAGSGDDTSSSFVAELRDLLNRMMVERIKQQETSAIAASATDPDAIGRYRELQTRRKALELALQQSAGQTDH
jgi:DNA primase